MLVGSFGSRFAYLERPSAASLFGDMSRRSRRSRRLAEKRPHTAARQVRDRALLESGADLQEGEVEHIEPPASVACIGEDSLAAVALDVVRESREVQAPAHDVLERTPTTPVIARHAPERACALEQSVLAMAADPREVEVEHRTARDGRLPQ